MMKIVLSFVSAVIQWTRRSFHVSNQRNCQALELGKHPKMFSLRWNVITTETVSMTLWFFKAEISQPRHGSQEHPETILFLQGMNQRVS